MHKKGEIKMKKGIGIWLIVALALIVSGAGLFSVGVMYGGSKNVTFGENGLKIGAGEDFHYESEKLDKLSRMDIDVTNLKVVIAPSDGDYYMVKCDVYDGYDEPQIEIKDGVLTVKQKHEHGFWIFNFNFSFDFRPNVMTIYVPKGSDFENITINSSNSAIRFEQAVNADYVNIDTSNGAIYIEKMTCNERLNAKTSNGAIDCDGIFNGEVTLKTSNGSIDIEGKYAKGVEAKSSNGRISADIDGRRKDYDLDLDTSNGSIRIDGNKVSDDYREDNKSNYEIYLKSSNGSIEVDFNR